MTADNDNEIEFDAAVLGKLHPEIGRLLGWMIARRGDALHVDTDAKIGAEIDGYGALRLLAPGDVWDATAAVSARLAAGASRFAIAGATGVPAAFVASLAEGLTM